MKYELNNIYNEDSYKAIKDIPDITFPETYEQSIKPVLIKKGGNEMNKYDNNQMLKDIFSFLNLLETGCMSHERILKDTKPIKEYVKWLEQALTPRSKEELKAEIKEMFRKEYVKNNLDNSYYLYNIVFTNTNIIVKYLSTERKEEKEKVIWINDTINGLFNLSLELASLIIEFLELEG